MNEPTDRERIKAARERAQSIAAQANELYEDIPPEFAGARESASSVGDTADGLVRWANERLANGSTDPEPARQDDRPSWSDLHATIVDLMRQHYQDPAGFHEALADHLDIAEEEYAPVRQFRIDAIPEGALTTLERVVDEALAALERSPTRPTAEDVAWVADLERAKATLDGARELS